jgi:hypothetical protein
MSKTLIEQEFIMIILNCRKYKNKASFQKATWLRFLSEKIPYYHVIGDENLDAEYKFDNESRTLWVRTPDDYISLPKKVLAAHKAILETYRFKYLFKTDDDQILVNPNFFKNLINTLLTSAPEAHYGGFVVDVKDNYLSRYNEIHPELPQVLPLFKTKYCSGRFYFLSRIAALNLQTRRVFIEKECLEDYGIGFHLNQTFKYNMIHIATNEYFTDIEKSDYPEWERKLLQRQENISK